MDEANPPPPPPPPPPPEPVPAPPPPPAPAADAAPKLSPEERKANLAKAGEQRKKRGFIRGIIAGILLVLILSLGGELFLWMMGGKIQVRKIEGVEHPLRLLVFLGMAAGIVITGLVIVLVLGLEGTGWVFGKKKVGLFRALGRGLLRIVKAAWSLGFTLSMIGGTAWFIIPASDWPGCFRFMKTETEKAVDRLPEKVRRVLKPAPPPGP